MKVVAPLLNKYANGFHQASKSVSCFLEFFTKDPSPCFPLFVLDVKSARKTTK